MYGQSIELMRQKLRLQEECMQRELVADFILGLNGIALRLNGNTTNWVTLYAYTYYSSSCIYLNGSVTD